MRRLMRSLGIGGTSQGHVSPCAPAHAAPGVPVEMLESRQLFAVNPMLVGAEAAACQPAPIEAQAAVQQPAVQEQSGVLGSSGGQVPGVELVGDVFGLPPSVLRGKEQKLSVQVINIGDRDTHGPIAVRLLLSTDGFADSSDILLGARRRRIDLRPGDDKFIDIKFTWPQTVANGTYEVIAEIDIENDHNEADENNAFLAPAPVLVADPFVDLVAEVPTAPPNTVRAGDIMDIDVTIRNVGNIKAKGQRMQTILVASNDIFPGSSDYLLLAVLDRQFGLRAGGSRTLRFKFVVSPTLEAQTWFLGASVDTTNVVAESNEGNNGGIAPSQFTRLPF